MKAIAGIVSVLFVVGLSVLIFTRQQGSWSLTAEQLAVAESGQMIEMNNGQVFMSHFSFFTQSGILCRMYSAGTESMSEQLACFDPEQGWLTFTGFQRVRAERNGEVAPRGSGEATGDISIQQQMRELGAGPTLSLDDERNALRQLHAD